MDSTEINFSFMKFIFYLNIKLKKIQKEAQRACAF
jgi:hypothetical protein